MRLANVKLIRYLLQISNPKIRIREAIEITDEMEGKKTETIKNEKY